MTGSVEFIACYLQRTSLSLLFYYGPNVKPMHMAFSEGGISQFDQIKHRIKMQYPVMNMHGLNLIVIQIPIKIALNMGVLWEL